VTAAACRIRLIFDLIDRAAVPGPRYRQYQRVDQVNADQNRAGLKTATIACLIPPSIFASAFF
jgi:hypothetical protein